MSAPLSPDVRRRLKAAARAAARAAYAPYSKFRVGACVLAGSGRLYSGCNVENASYGLTLCAERVALFAAVAAGERTIRAAAVYTPTRAPTSPCGACRQVLNEFGREARVVCLCDSKLEIETDAAALLPWAFGPASLKKAPAGKGGKPRARSAGRTRGRSGPSRPTG